MTEEDSSESRGEYFYLRRCFNCWALNPPKGASCGTCKQLFFKQVSILEAGRRKDKWNCLGDGGAGIK